MTPDDLFTHFPVIETSRLILRQPRIEDAEAHFRVFSDAEVLEFYDVLPFSTVAESQVFIGQLQRWYTDRQGIRWAITRRGEDVLLGTCGFFAFDPGFHRAEMGYELGRTYWRQGIMSEALQAILSFGFDLINFHRVEATVDDDNYRSKSLLTKLGFTYEGCRKQRFYFRERFIDEHLFGLLKADWQP